MKSNFGHQRCHLKGERVNCHCKYLVGGSNSVAGIPAGDGSLAIDSFNWTTFYGRTQSNQLLVYNSILDLVLNGFDTDRGGDNLLKSVQVIEDYDFGGFSDANYGRAAAGDLVITVTVYSFPNLI